MHSALLVEPAGQNGPTFHHGEDGELAVLEFEDLGDESSRSLGHAITRNIGLHVGLREHAHIHDDRVAAVLGYSLLQVGDFYGLCVQRSDDQDFGSHVDRSNSSVAAWNRQAS